ncbi:MAG: hypothetical protein A4E47_00598 [Methanosaeta sp. PtaU1.Bin028]|nr:MAG: hypothetical protein A4E47_00598 [Methanosaeta sp. PtaU1.Bin028]
MQISKSVVAFATLLILSMGCAIAASDQSMRPIPASEILHKVRNHQPVEYDHITVTGDLDLSKLIISSIIIIRNSKFDGVVSFNETTLDMPIDVSFSNLTKQAYFVGSTFNKNADFGGTTFNGYADYFESTFNDDAEFVGSTFAESAIFYQATFKGNAEFNICTFRKVAYFERAAFFGDCSFQDATISGATYFSRSKFSGYTLFDEAAFGEKADFSLALFRGYTTFDKADFSGSSDFEAAEFNDTVIFTEVTFSGDADFRRAMFHGAADFSWTDFKGDAPFDFVTFSRLAIFRAATFNGKAYFWRVKFNGNTSFFETTFSDDSDFRGAIFNRSVSFEDGRFKSRALFERSQFLGNLNLKGLEYDKLYVRWFNITELSFDDTAYLKLIENFRMLGYYSDADQCYVSYRIQNRQNLPLYYRPIDWLLWILYGYGTMPELPFIWSLLVIVLCGGFFYFTADIETPDKKTTLMEAMYFSASAFTSGARTLGGFVSTPEDVKVKGRARYVLAAEKLLGLLLVGLFLTALARTVIR